MTRLNLQTGRRSIRLLVGTTVLLALFAGVAYATIPGSDGVIRGCYAKSGGTLRVIDASVTNCKASETALNWNVGGPAGPPGQVQRVRRVRRAPPVRRVRQALTVRQVQLVQPGRQVRQVQRVRLALTVQLVRQVRRGHRDLRAPGRSRHPYSPLGPRSLSRQIAALTRPHRVPRQSRGVWRLERLRCCQQHRVPVRRRHGDHPVGAHLPGEGWLLRAFNPTATPFRLLPLVYCE